MLLLGIHIHFSARHSPLAIFPLSSLPKIFTSTSANLGTPRVHSYMLFRTPGGEKSGRLPWPHISLLRRCSPLGSTAWAEWRSAGSDEWRRTAIRRRRPTRPPRATVGAERKGGAQQGGGQRGGRPGSGFGQRGSDLGGQRAGQVATCVMAGAEAQTARLGKHEYRQRPMAIPDNVQYHLTPPNAAKPNRVSEEHA